MKIGAVNKKLAMTQWENLVNIYEHLGIKVWRVDQKPDLPDMVFCADQGIVYGKRVLISNFKFDERKGETEVYRKWFSDFGIEVLTLPSDVYFEGGGETCRWKDNFFVGTGLRTSPDSLKFIEQTLNVKVFGLELVNPRFYHLDTCFFVLNDDTAFYFPAAFSKKSINLIKKHVPNLFEFSAQDVANFAANSIVINQSVIIQSKNNHFAELLKGLNYTPIMTDVSEFIKSGGGIHCLTGILD